MRAKYRLRRGCLFFVLLITFVALTARQSWAQPHEIGGGHVQVLTAPVSIFFGGPGSGTVSTVVSVVLGSECAADCVRTVPIGKTIALTAVAGPNSLFAGWGGACSGTASPTCELEPSQATSVIAYFRSSFRIVAAGQVHSCVLRPNGTVTCWGRNDDAELGSGNGNLVVVPVAGINNAVAIAAGGFHTCALLVGGTVTCWGFNSHGQVGTESFGTDVPTPMGVRGITDAVALTAGGFHSCVIHAGGTASCWGANNHGQLGDGTTFDRHLPVSVNLAATGPLSQIAGGGFHTCAVIKASLLAVCWGGDNVGQLGIASHAEPAAPGVIVVKGGDPGCAGGITVGCASLAAPITALAPVATIAASIGGNQGGFHNVAIDTTGLDWGWGNNNESEINPTIGGEQDQAQRGVLAAPGGFTQIAAGASHTCMAAPLIGVLCRGDNHFGQSGPTPNSGAAATAVPLTLGAVSVAGGGFHTCAVVAPISGVSAVPPGTVMCWGGNDNGQVTTIPSPGTPVLFPVIVPIP